MKSIILRQGDILLKRESAIPKDAKLLSDRIIARGEATGHTHEIQGAANIYQASGQLLVEVAESAELVHQEHKTITIPAGIWSVNRQREYDPVQERQVSD